ncbi:D-glycero-beta-D-manno-heptose 1-phosphate adenylyltransferase [Desulfomicrobium salsuginis]
MHNTRNKILGRHEAHRLAGRGGVVFTNGCFDILHPGHVDYLQRARDLGERLVVGLNSDASVRRLKGPTRPVNDEASRAMVLSALSCVDHVVIFEEDTPYELIRAVAPDILVKGGDWSVDRIVGRDLVEERGGRVLSIPLLPGHSTTGIIDRILALNAGGSHADRREE